MSTPNSFSRRSLGGLALLLVVIAFLAPGCSMFSSSLQPVSIMASDPRAQIYVDGQLMGTGTVTVPLKRRRSHAVMARIGDRTGVAHIDSQISGAGVLDIVGGFFFLVPWIGIVGPGFKKLETDSIYVAIPPPSN